MAPVSGEIRPGYRRQKRSLVKIYKHDKKKKKIAWPGNKLKILHLFLNNKRKYN